MAPRPRGTPLATYHFLTEFEVDVPPGTVFDLVVRPEPWLTTWGDLLDVRRVEAGPRRGGGGALEGTVRAPLGYRLAGRIDIVEARRPGRVRMQVTGSIEGGLTWTLRPTPAGTGVRLAWTVRPVAAWLRMATPVARPALEAGHHAVVRHAVHAAADHLDSRVLAFRSRAGRRPFPHA